GTFTVTSDRPYVTVVPSSGPLPPEGTTVQVKIDPSGLDIGSTQSNLVITTNDGLGKNALGASKTTSTSVSVSKTTPDSDGQDGERASRHADRSRSRTRCR